MVGEFFKRLATSIMSACRWLNSNPRWESDGRLKYLVGRESDRALCAVDGVPAETIDRTLRLFCDAFDIPESQLYCLRPTDLIADIYDARKSRWYDDCEHWRLTLNVEKAIGRWLKSSDEQPKTIAELILLVHSCGKAFYDPESVKGE